MIALRILAVVAGVVVTAWVLWSAIRTVVVPRGESVRLTRYLFLVWRDVFEWRAHHHPDFEGYDRTMARYGPVALLTLPVAWALLVYAAFIPIYWGLGTSWHEAVVTSGSSFTTLGFDRPGQLAPELACFAEALVGLGLIALLISYLPAIYSAFSQREAEVIKLEARAGSPPSAAAFLIRIHRIRGLEYFATQWDGWEQWFSELEESHTSQPALAFFRSPRPRSSWITAAGAVLDTASLIVSCVEIDQTPQAQVTIRSGYLALRAIATFFGLPFDPDPSPDDPISIRRDEFDELLGQLREAGLPLRADQDLAWRDYAGWRVNYDQALLGLCALASAPPAPWSSDRIDQIVRPRWRRAGQSGQPGQPGRRGWAG